MREEMKAQYASSNPIKLEGWRRRRRHEKLRERGWDGRSTLQFGMGQPRRKGGRVQPLGGDVVVSAWPFSPSVRAAQAEVWAGTFLTFGAVRVWGLPWTGGKNSALWS